MSFATKMRTVLLVVATMFAGRTVAADDVREKFLPEGVTKKIGGYRPMRSEMDKDAESIKSAPEGLTAPKYGAIEIGDKSWAFILDEPEGEPAKLYIDTNGDGDLTNDPETKWESKTQGESTMYNGTGQVDLGDGMIGSLGLYRFDPKDERRAQLKNTLMVYVDYGLEFTFELDGNEFTTFVAGSLESDASLPIDRDGNGRSSRHFETAKMGEPFNFTGTTYVFSYHDGILSLEKSEEVLEQLPLPPDLTVGKPALQFKATTLDGAEVDFPKQYAGKLVMLDFWATWCGPCIGEIPNMKKAYADWHEKGFEILGVSFDDEDMQEKVTEFLKEKELLWSQIYEGKGWETTLGKMHDVSGIPFVLLVDGDTGEILATARDLRGEGLSEFIGEKLKQKSGSEK